MEALVTLKIFTRHQQQQKNIHYQQWENEYNKTRNDKMNKAKYP